uniref:Putative secreted protein n=1 Tax=Anopheles marajoara TaxID=58244 RepID=A0A2M4CDV6_9DIPT
MANGKGSPAFLSCLLLPLSFRLPLAIIRKINIYHKFCLLHLEQRLPVSGGGSNYLASSFYPLPLPSGLTIRF